MPYWSFDHPVCIKKNLLIKTTDMARWNNEFKKMNFPENKIKRIDAVNEKYNGHIGCCKSHIKAMNEIIKNDYKLWEYTCYIYK